MNKFTLNLPTQPPTQEELDFLQSVIEAEESEEEFINRIDERLVPISFSESEIVTYEIPKEPILNEFFRRGWARLKE